ncbi:CCG-6 clock-controlled protein 6 (ccg-6) [Claviceps purpurea 20.1]|uniref:CCG-6 clock-controlled protein 6 (Ccg-6) n=1 Tax=Claviceps purpurea (strain 20.1) TaxID=1111077 RepID=M1VX51_CLAP2|nr:CCG-6 clock-controlled protein 6 (ccg-6) [Claviceps purpurea 20.1]
MKYATALIAAAVGAQAWSSKNGTQVVTEVVDQYVTYCPGPTHITHGDKVYTVTKPTTLTITNCPCTITRPVVSTSAVVCHTCTAAPSNPANTEPAATVPAPAPTGGLVMTPTKGQPSTVPTAGAGKAAALSGAGLAGIVGLAAFVL